MKRKHKRTGEKKKNSKIGMSIIGVVALCVIGLGIWYFISKNNLTNIQQPVYEMSNPTTGAYKYTTDISDYYNQTKSGTWKARGIVWEIPKSTVKSPYKLKGSLGSFANLDKNTTNAVPIYQLEKNQNNTATYFYTIDENSKAAFLKDNWKSEGIIGYAYKHQTSVKLAVSQNFPCPRVTNASGEYLMYGQGQMASSTNNSDYRVEANTQVTNSAMGPEANEVVKIGDKYVLYYGTVGDNNRPDYLNVATSKNAKGPFTPISEPLVTISTQGESNDIIDPSVIKVENKYYLSYVQDINGDNSLQMVELSKDGLTTVGGPKELLNRNSLKGTATRLESPSITQAPDGTFVLFFSGNWATKSEYYTGFATSKTINGTYQYGGSFISQMNTGLDGPGEGSVFIDGDKNYFFFNAWEGPRDDSFRVLPGGKGRYVYSAQFKWVNGHLPVLN